MTVDDQDFVVLGEKDLVGFNAAGLLPQSVDDIRAIQKWLHPTDYSSHSSEYNKHLASYSTGTGEWIVKTEQYQRWLNSEDKGTLWIKAVAGAGKSVVAAHMASKLAEGNIPVLHFFFRQIITTNRTPQSLVRDWISQVLEFSPLLQIKLKELVKRDLESVAFDELWNLLYSAIQELPRVYCIADALDEMDMENPKFMLQLVRLGSTKPASVKVMLTSRPLPRIETVLNDPTILQIPLRLHLVEPDIAVYVENRLLPQSIKDDLKIFIQQAVCRKAQGLFLYARLMIDDILESSEHGFQDIQDRVNKLPSGLNEMYNKMLFEHSCRSGVPLELQLIILQSVTHASRPLRLLEIATMVSFLRATTHPKLLIHSPGKDAKSIVRAACGPLLEILEDETVSIIHHSFTEFLFGQGRSQSSIADPALDHFPVLDFAATHRAMADICIRYLLSDWSESWRITAFGENRTCPHRLWMEYPFLNYAITYWHYHLTHSGVSDERIFLQLDYLMEPKSKRFLSLLDLMDYDSRPNKISPLHVAASKGLHYYAEHLIKEGHDVNLPASKNQTALHLAAHSGHEQVALVLLQNEAANDTPDYAGRTPIHLASRSNHHRVVKILLENGVDPMTPKTRENPGSFCLNAYRTTGDTAVLYACQNGHTKTVKELVPFLDADNLSKALCWAAASGNPESLLAILESPELDINKRVHGSTAIYLASGVRDLISMEKLLHFGADVSIRSSDTFHRKGFGDDRYTRKYTPLHAFSQHSRSSGGERSTEGLLQGFKLLLDAGCDINLLDDDGESAFHRALRIPLYSFQSPNTKVITYLLDRGADPLLKTAKGYSALHLLPGDAPDAVKLLIAHGTDINAKLPDGQTALFRTINSHSDLNFLALLECGADCNTQDNNGDTLLHLALKLSNPSIPKIKLLLESGADPNYKNKAGETPLHTAQISNLRESWSVLKLAEANLESKTKEGLTVLLRAIKGRLYADDLKTLLDAGAMINARTLNGQTVLHLLCDWIQNETLSLVSLLVERGADPAACDFAGNTILHQLAGCRDSTHNKDYVKLMGLFINMGVSPTCRNHAGQTPFHIASSVTPNDWRSRRSAPYMFFLGSKCNIDINTTDHSGVQPVHIAAALSERQVHFLLDDGADPFAITSSGQSALHLACIARQSNIAGLLIDVCGKRGGSAFVNHVDNDGRTALHYACKSGRLETVKILLDGGADVNIKTNIQYAPALSPLDMCLDFEKDDLNLASKESSENQTLGVRRIIQELVGHGADISFLAPSELRRPYQGRGSTFAAAVSGDHEVIVDELLQMSMGVEDPVKISNPNSPRQKPPYHSDSTSDDDSSDDLDDSEVSFNYSWGATPWNHFLESRTCLRYNQSLLPLQSFVKAGDNNLQLFMALLRTENYKAILELQKSGVDLFKPLGSSCISVVVSEGYGSLLKQILEQAHSINAAWLEEFMRDDTDGKLNQLLHDACRRALPNIDVVKVLVEKLRLNVNYQNQERYGPAGTCSTALHILACSEHWWQPQALQYLCDHGAGLNICDGAGNTPLHVAVMSSTGKTAVQILLLQGANPNILDKSNASCLNKAKDSPELIQLLIASGADISIGTTPFIFDAIKAMDITTVKMLAEMGANFNVRPEHVDDGESDSKCDDAKKARKRRRRKLKTFITATTKSYPVHFAACEEHEPEKCAKMLPIIELLLRGGADPWLSINNEGDTILHDICINNGILQPFLELPSLDLETRDQKGRTLLLAACSSTDGYIDLEEWRWEASQTSAVAQLLQKGAEIRAVDNQGSNVLHSLLGAKISDSRANSTVALKPNFELLLSNTSASELVLQKDLAGSVPLHFALKYEKLWAVEGLLDKGADPIKPDPNGDTALHHLARQFVFAGDYAYKPNLPAISLFSKFLTFGGNINTPNKYGETPIFHFLSVWDDMDSLLRLIDAGADLNVKNKKGQGLLHVIAKLKYRSSTRDANGAYLESTRTKIFRWLMEKGLNPMDEDEEQRTSLDLSAANGNEEILRLFKRT